MGRKIILAPLVLAACGPGGSGGKCKDILPGDLVISEIFADYAAPTGGSGADAGHEWFEVYNASDAPIDLQDITITLERPDGTKAKTHTMQSLTINAGAYAVLGDVTSDFVTGFLDYGYGSDLGEMFNTDGGKITLSCGDAEIDAATYADITSGHSTGFDGGIAPDFTANDDLAMWCEPPADDAHMFEDANYGTPGQANPDCMVVTPGMCNDGGNMRATVTPVPGDVVITEADPNSTTPQASTEWFEALAVHDFDLNGVILGRANGDTDTIASEDCLPVTAGTYLVFAHNGDSAMNGGLPRVDGLFTFSLVDDAQLQDPSGALLDAVTFTGAGSAKSFQLDPDFFDAAGNDDEGVWCDGTVIYGSGPDKGTPGAANEECVILPPPGMCHDTGLGSDRAIVAPTVGQVAITEVFPNNTGSDVQTQDWIELRAYASFDLNESVITKGATGSTTILTTDCIHLDAGQYALLAGSTNMSLNGGLTTVDAAFSFSFNQSGTATLNDRLGALLDTVTYSSTDGKAKALDPDIVIGAQPNIDNDNTANWCNASTQYNGTDFGTPRLDNDTQCP